ncbi:hypothetical protein, partial, partial [Absidia glauca]
MPKTNRRTICKCNRSFKTVAKLHAHWAAMNNLYGRSVIVSSNVEAQPTLHDAAVQQEADNTFDFGFDMDSNVDIGNGDNSETSSAAQFTE